jgi:lipooligosaccharide transport system permease protein
MVGSALLPRVLAALERRGGNPFAAPRGLGGALAVTRRNVVAARHSAYWWVILSGFFEPVLYLLSIGIGVGALVGDFRMPDGKVVSYAGFVAPAMLAASAMNGALAETTMNFFAKMKNMRLYDGVLATPVTPMQVAFGELIWALSRGLIYSVAFLGLMVGMGLTSVGWALATLPVTVLVGFGFGGLGMALTTFLRGYQDFDYITVTQFGLFLFSGTFAPAGDLQPVLRALLEITPLYHGVELIRGFTVGSPSWSLLWHAAYLLGLAAVGLWVAGRRMRRQLLK